MKKIILLLLCLTFMSGCTSEVVDDTTSRSSYETLQSQLEAQTDFAKESRYFTLTSKYDSNKNIASIILGDVKVEMYDVQAIVLDPMIVHNQGVWPQFNVLQPVEKAHFIPGQSMPERGVYDGFNISFETTSESVVVLVKWHNRSNTQSFTEYIRVTLKSPPAPIE